MSVETLAAREDAFAAQSLVFERLEIGICVVKLDPTDSAATLRVVVVNALACKLLNGSVDGAVGKRFQDVFAASDAQSWAAKLAVVAENGQPANLGRIEHSGDTFVLTAERLEPFVACIRCTKMVEPERLETLQKANDALMVQVQQLREAAESTNQVKRAFLSNMSHELRTPLNAILGFAQLMSRGEQLSPEQQENLAVIQNSGHQLLRLINDVLESSKMDAGLATRSASLLNFSTNLDNVPDVKPARRITSVAPGQPQYKVLIAEDRWENRKLLELLLLPLGFLVQSAVNGADAVKLWQEWGPHVILMDLQMPVMDGYQATAAIKKSSKNRSVCVIALSASAFEENRDLIMESGCDDFIRKPFRPDDLLAALELHIGVKYVEASDDGASKHHAGDGDAISLEGVTAAWRTAFARANEQLDVQAMERLLSQLGPTHDKLVQLLRALVHDYAFEHIASVLGNISARD